MVITNVLTNPSFEVNTAGWDGTLTRANTIPSAIKAGSWYVTATTSSARQSHAAPATAGQVWSGSAWFNKDTTLSKTCAVSVRFFDSGGVELEPPTDTLVALTAMNVPERRTYTRTAPTGTASVELWLLRSAISNIQMDACMLTQTSTAMEYFDGSTAPQGFDTAWTGTPHASTSTATENGEPYVKARYTASAVTTANPTVTVTEPIVAGDNLLLFGFNGESDVEISAVSGCGATWSKISNTRYAQGEAWIGVGATTAGVVTTTAVASGSGRALSLYHVANASSTVIGATNTATDSGSSPVISAGLGQIAFGTTYTRLTSGGITSPVPSTGWVSWPVLETLAGARFVGQTHRVPATTTNHSFTGNTTSGNVVFMQEVVLGSLEDAPIESAFSASGTLTSELAYQKRIASDLNGSGTLTTAFTNYLEVVSNLTGSGTLSAAMHRHINSTLTGTGSLSSVLGQVIRTSLSGTGTLSSTFHRYISSGLSGAGTLSSVLTNYVQIDTQLSGSGTLVSTLVESEIVHSGFYGSGTLVSTLAYSPRFTSGFSGEGVLFSELGYVVHPPELGTAPLGKLVNYSVGTSAVPLNPAEGSGSAPTVSATYLKGPYPELALGELNVLSTGNIGAYEGEIVNLSMDKASSNVRVSMSTPLSLLNTEMALFPFVDAAESTWTAVRAIEYWTQQCGLFYDKVPGEVVAYTSAYGHNNSYAAGTATHFYERLTGGTTATTVVNERSVKTFGFNTTATTAFHEDDKAGIPLTLLNHRKVLFSIGLGIRGTGRTATVNWNFLDPQDKSHVFTISATSAGLITATVDGVTLDSTTVDGDANYRITASLETLGSTKLGKLTVHTDDLAGNGSVTYSGSSRVLNVDLPSALRVKTITHESVGGSGSLMLRWGTYLSIDKTHPTEVPVIQKTFAESKKPRLFVSGFEGNVWNMLNQFCAIARLDVRYFGQSLYVGPRLTALTAPDGNFSEFQYSAERRDKYKQVAVVNLQSRADTTDTALLWRADSVYSVAAREIFETTVQTEHSILNVVNPVCVDGIWPFPYRQGGGQYVVTGADGYIVSPQWWNDNGGKVEVSLTGKHGEIALKITAPTIDTVRAPYRISEGEADRPALYIGGSGILNEPKEVHVGTGAKNAKEGFDDVFESPFMSGVVETYDTAMAMASEYSAHNAEVDFEIPNDFDKPSRFGQFPAGTLFTDNVRNYRIENTSQSHSKVSGTAVTHTTIGAYVDSFPEGATLADAKARHFGKTIRQFNITPLRGTSV